MTNPPIPMIQHVKIENYRSIDKLSVDLSPVTVLIGKSGSGKSNFCHALRFLRDLLKKDIRTVVQSEGGAQRITPAWVPQGKGRGFKITLDFTLEDNNAYRYEIMLHFTMLSIEFEALYVNQAIVFSRTGNQWQQKPPVLNLPQLQAHQLALGQLPATPEAVYAFSTLTSNVAYHNFHSEVLSTSKPDASSRGLDDNAQNFRDVLVELNRDIRHRKSKEHLMQSLRLLNESIQSIEPDSTGNRISIAHKAGDLVIDMDLANESDGLRRFYAHLLALYQTPSKYALIFEEPENAIYPAALQILANEFKRAPEEGRGQVIITTHNPTLLDYFDPKSIRVVEREKDGLATRIGPLDPSQVEALKAHDLYPSELFSVDPARMAQEA